MTSGDFDEIDNVDEQIALFAGLLVLLGIVLLLFVFAVTFVVVGWLHFWDRFLSSQAHHCIDVDRSSPPVGYIDIRVATVRCLMIAWKLLAPSVS